MDKQPTKTLIGKDNYLFLINDSAKELEVHCNNLNLVNEQHLQKYKFDHFLLIVFPNKSLIYKEYLPQEYVIKHRPALNMYKRVLNKKIFDAYDILKNEKDVYYKTDTHINIKGAYIVYKQFIQKINNLFHLNIKPKECVILNKQFILSNLQLGIGDLLWSSNLGQQHIEDHTDTFYYSDDIDYIYCKHIIQQDGAIRLFNKQLIDKTAELHGSVLSWDILSNFILYQKKNLHNNNNNNNNNNLKVLIFYDSFLTSTLSLYLDLFDEIYMIKDIYNTTIIDTIKPDFVFEFRVERFLF